MTETETRLMARLANAGTAALAMPSESADDIYQDTVAMAFQLLRAYEAKGRDIPGEVVAFYAMQRAKCGRRSTGRTTADVYGGEAQLSGKSTLAHEALVEDATGKVDMIPIADTLVSSADVARTVATRMDWSALWQVLTPRERAVVQGFAANHSKLATCAAARVHATRHAAIRRRVARKILAAWGPDVLADLARRSLWQCEVEQMHYRFSDAE